MIVNPIGVRAALEGQIMQGISRALHEEVHFDEKCVKSVDWTTYRIANLNDVPSEVDIVLINRPDKPIGGAGEPAIVCFPAAIARRRDDWGSVALLDCQQMAVAGDLERCIRLLAHAWLPAEREVAHTYLREAARLRPDLVAGS
jgi:hypothetical protein